MLDARCGIRDTGYDPDRASIPRIIYRVNEFMINLSAAAEIWNFLLWLFNGVEVEYFNILSLTYGIKFEIQQTLQFIQSFYYCSDKSIYQLADIFIFILNI